MACVKNVLIVGGGIAGQALACALAKRHIACEIVELRRGFEIAGAAMTFQGTALRALLEIGLTQETIAAGWQGGNTPVSFLDNTGEVIFEPEILNIVGPEFPPQIAIRRQAVHDVLQRAVRNAGVNIDEARLRQKPEAPFQEAKQAVDLSQAERIVSVGRGIKSQENIALAERLAAAMHAEVAASRPICDNGWLPMERQVGSSGQTVAPKVYVALGISGAIQHLVGMKGSRTIVAINKDAEAPIFEVADYGVVGDLFEIAPALITELDKQ